MEDRINPAPGITINVGASGSGTLDTLVADGTILFGEGGPGNGTLSTGALAAIPATTNIVIEATDFITFTDVATLTLLTGAANSVTFRTNTAGGTAISFTNVANTLATSGASITLEAGTNLTLANLNANGGNVLLTAGNQASGDLSAQNILNAGNLTMTAGHSTGGTVTQTGNAAATSVTITAADVVLVGTVNSGAGITTIQTSFAGRPIDLGTNAAGALGLTAGELNLVTAGTLRVGNGTAGAITVSAAVSPAGTSTFSLINNAAITQTGPITETNLRISSVGPVTLTNTGNDVDTLAASVTGAGNAFSFTDANALTVGSVDGVNGVSTSNGAITVTTTNGNLVVLDTPAVIDVNAGTAAVSLTAGGAATDRLLDIQANAVVAGTGGITLSADNISIGVGSAVNAGGASATLRPFENGTLIDLGGPDAANTLGLTDAELDRVVTAEITVGSASSGNVSITAIITTLNTLQLLLVTGGAVVDSGPGQVIETRLGMTAAAGLGTAGTPLDIICASLEASGGTGGVFISATANPIVVGGVSAGLSGISATGGNIVLTNSASLTFNEAVSHTSGGNITLTTTGGNLTITAAVTASGGNGNVVLAAAITITVNAAVSIAGTGTLAATADSDVDGFGEFVNVAAGTLTTAGGNITIIGADVDLGGNANANAGAGTVFLRSSTNAAIDLGTDTGFGLLDSDLDRVTAGIIHIGNASSGTITVSAVLTVASGATLSLQTGGNINVNAAVSASGGNGNITLSANNTITVNAAVSVAGTGTITAMADANADGSGEFINTGTGTLTTANGNATLLGADVDLGAAINAGTGTVFLQPSTAAAIDLGTDTGFGLLDSDLDRITAGIIKVGTSTSGSITLSATLNPAASSTLSLETAGSINQTGGTITVGNLALRAAASVTFPPGNNIGTLAASLTGANQGLTYADADGLTVGTVDGVVGITTSNGPISLTAGGAGNVLTVSSAVASGGANVTLTADDMVLNAVVNAGTARAILQPFTPGRNIDLGTNSVGRLALTDVELDRVTAGVLQVGYGVAGDIFVTAAIDPVNTTTLVLITNSQTTGTGAITTPNLRITSTNGVTLTGNNDVDTLAVSGAGFGLPVMFTDMDDLVVGIVDGITGITTSNGAVILTADDLDVQQAVNAGTNRVTLQPFTANRAIDLGSNTAGQLSLTDAELDRVTASVLQIGYALAGTITVSAAISPLATNTLTLRTSAGVGGSGAITVANLRVSAANAVALTGSNDVDILAAAVSNAGQAFAFTDIDDLIVGTVDVLSGITTSGGNVTLTANDLDVQQALAAGAGTVTLQPFAAGRAIDLGTETVGRLSLTDAELDRITTAMLKIGNSGSGAMTLSAALTPAGTSTLSLQTGSTLTQTAGSLTVSNLALRMGGAVTFLAGNDISTLAASLTGASSILSYSDANSLTVGVVDGVTGITTTNGFVSLTASGANNALVVNNAITTGNGGVALNADNMALNAAINAGTGQVTLNQNTAGQVIDLGGADAVGTLGLTSTELNQVTSSWLLIGSFTSGNLVISAAIAPTGVSNLGLFTAGSISGAGTITETNLLLEATGPITLTGNNDVDTLAARVTGAGSTINFTDIDDLMVGSLFTGAGVAGVLTNNGAITLTANDLDVQQPINAGTGTVAVQPLTAGRPINLGTETAGQLSLTDAELDRITAAVLRLGNSSAGAITVSAAVSPAGSSILALTSAGTISGSGALSVANLRLSSAGAVTLTGANDVTTLAANVSGASQPFAFTDANSFTVGTVDGTSGITTSNGAVTLTNTAAGSTLTVNNVIAAGDANVSLTADDMALNAAIGAGSGIATLQASVLPRSINLGTNAAGSLGLTDAELDRITAVLLRVGSTGNTGDISITAPISATTYGTLSLRTGGAVTQTAGSTVTVPHLAIQATNTVTMTELNDVQTTTLAASITGASQGFHFTDANSLTVGTVDGVSGITTNGGAITLTAQSANSTLTTSNALTSNGGTITLSADNIALNADINAGAGNVVVQPTSANQAINLGGADAAGTLGLTSVELNIIIASRLTIGNTSSGAITLSAALAPAGTSSLSLINNGAVSGAGSVTETNLRLSSAGPVTLTGNNDVTTLAAQVGGAGNSFVFQDANGFIVGTVDGIVGITTANGAVLLTADDLDVQQPVNAGTSTVALQSVTAGRPINLGTDTAGQLSLTDAELDRITAAVLRLGSTAAGAITISAAVSPAGSAALALTTAGTISGSGTIVVANLRTSAAGAVTLTGANDVTTLAAGVTDASQPFTFTDANSFTVGTVDGTSGITTNNGSVTLTGGAGGTVTVDNAITVGNATITLNADDLAINAGVSGGTQVVTLQTVTVTRTIDLGSNTANTLGLTDTELDRVTAGTLRIGSLSSTGAINVSASITATSYSTLTLRTGGAITDGSGSEQTDLTVANLTLQAGSGIGAGNDLNIGINLLAFSNIGGAVAISNDRALVLGSVDGVVSSSNTGTTTALTATGSLNFTVNLTSGDTLTATGIETNTATDSLTVNSGVTLQSTGGSVVLRAGDLVDIRSGALVQASAGTVTLETGFGDNDGSGAVTLNGSLIAATTPSAVGGTGVDTFTINVVTASGLTLDGRQGSDIYVITLGSINGAVSINDSGTGDTDQVQIIGTIGSETFTITPSQLSVGTNTIGYSTALERMTVTGGVGDDTFTVTPSTNMAITLDGGELRLFNVLNFDSAGQSVTVLGNSFNAAGRQPVTYNGMTMTHVGNAGGALQFAGNLTANQRFVQTQYYQYLGRLGSTAELDAWVATLGTISTNGVTNAIIRSPEAVGRVVDRLYIYFLDRPSDAVSRALWVNYLRTPGVTLEQVVGAFVSSAEFGARADVLFNTGNSNGNFIRSLYSLQLRRTPSDAEVNAWLGPVANAGRNAVALAFVGSNEFREATVRSFYGTNLFPTQPYWRNVLHRTAAAPQSDINSWVALGLDLQAIEILFAGSSESFNNG